MKLIDMPLLPDEYRVLENALASASRVLRYRAGNPRSLWTCSLAKRMLELEEVAAQLEEVVKRLAGFNAGAESLLQRDEVFPSARHEEIIRLLMAASDIFGGFGGSDLESDIILPPASVREAMHQFYAACCTNDPEACLPHEPFTTYWSLFDYFAMRLNASLTRKLLAEVHLVQQESQTPLGPELFVLPIEVEMVTASQIRAYLVAHGWTCVEETVGKPWQYYEKADPRKSGRTWNIKVPQDQRFQDEERQLQQILTRLAALEDVSVLVIWQQIHAMQP